jgi:cytosine/adenosine deaminase-related metal-dependent hydrolase
MLFLEDRIGSIGVGRDADLVVLERNLFDIPADQVAATRTLMTVSNGDIVFVDSSLSVTERWRLGRGAAHREAAGLTRRSTSPR